MRNFIYSSSTYDSIPGKNDSQISSTSWTKRFPQTFNFLKLCLLVVSLLALSFAAQKAFVGHVESDSNESYSMVNLGMDSSEKYVAEKDAMCDGSYVLYDPSEWPAECVMTEEVKVGGGDDFGEILSLQGTCVDGSELQAQLLNSECAEHSRLVFKDLDTFNKEFNGLVWSIGQFVDHDLTLIFETHKLSVPVEMPEGSFEFSASKTTCPSGFGNRISEISLFLDLSSVYHDNDLGAPVRSGKYMSIIEGNLPTDGNGHFVCGDIRCNENVFLTMQHTVWAIHHNIIVEEIEPLMSDATDDELYETAKQINIATYQQMVFDEFLPILVGDVSQEKAGSDDVTLSPLFAGAAYRLHHLVNDEFELKDGSRAILRDHFFNPKSFVENGGNEHWLTQLLKQKSPEFGAHMSFSLQHALFAVPGMDLSVRNCMRGYDMNLPSYNEARVLMGLEPQVDFSWSTCPELEEIYEDVSDVELFIGGSCEAPDAGMVGETFGAIIKDQFLRVRDNDPSYGAPHPLGQSVDSYRTLAEVYTKVTGVEGFHTGGSAFEYVHRQ